jgi:RNA polymerase sigma-70 factor (sigma-E family)
VNPTFEQYVGARGHALLRFGTLLTGDRHLAEDLVQEALARAHPKWGRIGAMEHPDAYVRRMVVNLFLSWRRLRSSRVTPTDAVPEVLSAADHGHDLAERDAMWRLLATLPKQQRAVLVLRFYEGLGDEDIAALIGCSPSTVRVHASKALARLRTTSTTITNGATS